MTVSATPYMFINDQMQTYAGLKARIGSGAKFDAVNTHIRNQMVMPGQLVIVPDESSRTLLPTEIEMVRLAQGIRHQTAEAAPDFLKNNDLLLFFSNERTSSPLGVGAGGRPSSALGEIAGAGLGELIYEWTP